MNAVLRTILETGRVFDGTSYHDLHSHMDAEEGAMIGAAIGETKAKTSLEVGFAYGLSTLFICDALAANGGDRRHIAIDPFQLTQWHGIGLRNCREAGYGKMVEFIGEPSEVCLPRLMNAGTKVDFALIDGWHTLDHTLIDFFYVNRMLSVGGIVVVDDTAFPAINRLMRYLLAYPAYQLWGVTGASPDMRDRFKEVAAHYAEPLHARKSLNWKSLPHEFFGRCVALKKVAEDTRTWDWYCDF